MAMPFLRAVVTDVGATLMGRVQNGEGTISFVSMVTGSGIYSDSEKSEESLKSARDLKSFRNRYEISSKTREGSSVRLSSVITNQDVESKEVLIHEGYFLNEIGIKAKITGEDTEVLYAIAVTSGEKGDFLPAFSEGRAAQILQSFYLTVANEGVVNLVSSDGAVAFSKDVNEKISAISTVVDEKLSEVKQLKTQIEQSVTEKLDETNQKISEEAEKRFKDLYGLANKTVTLSSDKSTVTSISNDVKVTTTISKNNGNTTLTTVVEKGEQEQEGYEKYTKTTTMTKLSDGRTQVTVNYVKNV